MPTSVHIIAAAFRADEKLRAVFGRDRCTMFEMQKLLSSHLTAA